MGWSIWRGRPLPSWRREGRRGRTAPRGMLAALLLRHARLCRQTGEEASVSARRPYLQRLAPVIQAISGNTGEPTLTVEGLAVAFTASRHPAGMVPEGDWAVPPTVPPPGADFRRLFSAAGHLQAGAGYRPGGGVPLGFQLRPPVPRRLRLYPQGLSSQTINDGKPYKEAGVPFGAPASLA